MSSLDEDNLLAPLQQRTGLPDDRLELPAYRLTMSTRPPPKRRGLFGRR